MTQEKTPSDKQEDTQYLKKPVLEETDIPNPIQGPVKSPDKLYHFMKDVHDSTVPKMWAVFLNEDYISLGNEPLAIGEAAEPARFIEITGNIYHYYALFLAKRYILITNHITDDAAPTEADKKLISALQADERSLSFRPNFHDYVIVAGDHYWSMTTQNGTACHCGQQHYIPDA